MAILAFLLFSKRKGSGGVNSIKSKQFSIIDFKDIVAWFHANRYSSAQNSSISGIVVDLNSLESSENSNLVSFIKTILKDEVFSSKNVHLLLAYYDEDKSEIIEGTVTLFKGESMSDELKNQFGTNAIIIIE